MLAVARASSERNNSEHTEVLGRPPPAQDGARIWEQLHAVDLAGELRDPVPTCADNAGHAAVPLRSAVRIVLTQVVKEVRAAGAPNPAAIEAKAARSERASKLFMLVPPRWLAVPTISHSRSRRADAAVGGSSTPSFSTAPRVPPLGYCPPSLSSHRVSGRLCVRKKQSCHASSTRDST